MTDKMKEIWVISGYILPAGDYRLLLATDTEKLAQAFKNSMESKGWCAEMKKLSFYEEKDNEQFVKLWFDDFNARIAREMKLK